jgi:hypothetical protein
VRIRAFSVCSTLNAWLCAVWLIRRALQSVYEQLFTKEKVQKSLKTGPGVIHGFDWFSLSSNYRCLRSLASITPRPAPSATRSGRCCRRTLRASTCGCSSSPVRTQQKRPTALVVELTDLCCAVCCATLRSERGRSDEVPGDSCGQDRPGVHCGKHSDVDHNVCVSPLLLFAAASCKHICFCI